MQRDVDAYRQRWAQLLGVTVETDRGTDPMQPVSRVGDLSLCTGAALCQEQLKNEVPALLSRCLQSNEGNLGEK